MNLKIINSRRLSVSIFLCIFGLIIIYSPSVEASYITSVNSQWGNNGSSIFYNDGNVGIGTTTPTNALFVQGTFRTYSPSFDYGFTIDPNNGSGPQLQLGNYSSPSAYFAFGAWGGTNNINTQGRNFRIYSASDSTGINYTTAGAFGIGTTTPAVKLTVNGGTNDVINVAGGFIGGLSIVPSNRDQAVSLGYLQDNYSQSSGSLWKGTLNGNIWNGDAGVGNVGIGTTTPSAKLEVYGGNLKINGGNLYLADTTGQNATFLQSFGAGGNLWMIQPGATQSFIIADGVNWDRSLAFNYTPGTTGAGAGRLTIGQVTKNSSTFTHGITSFYTNGLERMRIDNAGNVGIGLTNPSYKLDVADSLIRQSGYLVADAATNNMVANGDFELGNNSGWSAGTVVTGGLSGKYALQLTGSVTLTGNDYIPVDPTKDIFQLEAWVKKTVAGSTPGVLYFGYIAYDANKTLITSAPCGTYCYFAASALVVPVDSNWHKVSATTVGEGTAYPNFPVGTRYVQVMGLINYSASSDAVTLVDHVTLKRLSNAPLIAGNNFSTSNLLDQNQYSKLYTTNANNLILEPPSSGKVGIGLTNPTIKLTVNNGTGDVINVGGGSVAGLNLTPINDDQAVPLAYLKNNYSPNNPASSSAWLLTGNTLTSDNSWLGSISNYDISFRTNNTERMRILKGGNVGIGTTAPIFGLQVSGTGDIGGEYILRSGGTSSSFYDNSTNSLITPQFSVRKDDSATTLASAIPAFSIYNRNGANNTWMKMAFVSNETSGTGNPTSIAGIAAQKISGADNSWSSGDIALWTKNAGAVVEVLRATAGGNVGIGTTNPTSRLELTSSDLVAMKVNLSNTSNGVSAVQFNRASSNVENAFNWATNGTNKWFLGQDNNGSDDFILYNWTGNKWLAKFYDSTGNIGFGNSFNTLYIQNSGNVGIGSTTPAVKLTVNGGTNDVINVAGGSIGGLSIVPSNRDQAVSLGYLQDNYSQSSGSLWKGTLNGNIWNGDAGAGNVGIGTTNPGAKLDVNGAINAVTFNYPASPLGGLIGSYPNQNSNNRSFIYSISSGYATVANHYGLSFNQSNNSICIDGNGNCNVSLGMDGSSSYFNLGNVGIGITNPSYKLHVNGDSYTATSYRVGETAQVTNDAVFDSYRSSTATSTNIYGGKFFRYLSGSNTNNNTIYGVYAQSGPTTGATMTNAAGIYGMAQTFGTGVLTNAYSIYADSPTGNVTNAFSIYAAGSAKSYFGGNVGIGTTNPTIKLTVDGGTGNAINVANGYISGLSLTPINDDQAVPLAYLKNNYSPNNPASSSAWLLTGNTLASDNSWLGSISNYDVSFRTNNTERMRILKGGNVGIGITNPGVKLTTRNGSNGWAVNTGSAQTYGAFRIEGGDNAVLDFGVNTSSGAWLQSTDKSALNLNYPLIIQPNGGNVGIGTTAPSTPLQVHVGSDSNVRVGSSGAAAAFIDSLNDARTTYQRLEIYGNPLYLNAGNIGNVVLVKDGGNVGIGTANPGSKLDITGTETHVSGDLSGSDAILRLYNNYNSDVAEKGSVITFEDNYLGTTRTTRAAIKGGTATAGNTADGFLSFYTDSGSANSMQERMRINQLGNVGIGTTTPAIKLTVNGSSGDVINVAGGSIGGLSIVPSNRDQAVSLGYLQDNYSQSSGSLWKGTLNGNIWNGDAGVGNVGIGTTTPTEKLTVSSLANSGILLNNSSGSRVAILSYQSGADAMFGGGEAGRAVLRSEGRNFIIGTDNASYYLALGTGLAERMRITGAGNVGIGTTNPLGKFNVNVGTDQNFVVRSGTGGVTELYGVDNTGGTYKSLMFNGGDGVTITGGKNVGIGTTSPIVKLDVLGRGAFGSMASNRNSYGNTLSLVNSGSSDTSLFLWQAGAASGHFGFSSGSNLLRIVNSTSDGSLTNAASINLTSGGNVGIGTTTPANKLTVNGGTGDVINVLGGSIGGLNSTPVNADQAVPLGYLQSNYSSSASSSASSLWKGTLNGNIWNGDAGAGKVGIGTTSPTHKLHIYDNSAVTNSVTQAQLYIQNAYNNMSGHASIVLDKGAANASAAFGFLSAGVSEWDAGIIDGNNFVIRDDINNKKVITAEQGAGDNALYIQSGGRVGIGTSNPASALSVISSTTQTFNGQNYYKLANFTAGGGYNYSMYGSSNNGNDGLVISTPNTAFRVDIGNRLGDALLFGGGDSGSGNNTYFSVSRTAANGGNILLDAFNSGVGGSNIILNSRFGVGNVGISSTTPAIKLSVNGGTGDVVNVAGGFIGGLASTPVRVDQAVPLGYLNNNFAPKGTGIGSAFVQGGNSFGTAAILGTNDNYALNFEANNTTWMTILAGGNVGIGTTTPASKLTVNGTISANGIISTGDLDMNQKQIIGVSKLTVSAIDPLYSINGIKYSTYAPSIVGSIKEEYTGKINLNTKNKVTREYEGVIDFSTLNTGSDLWIWRKVVDFNRDNVEVTFAPYGRSAQVYYLIDNNKLIFRSDRAVEISYRLTGKRFDWRKWPTLATDQSEKGIEVSN